jgi:putative CocE/NonD family hydrolase
MKEIHLEWFDHWLKGKENRVQDWPLTKYYLMSKNKWVESMEHWPINPKREAYYLASEGNANTYYGDGKLEEKPGLNSKDCYIYNPEDPAKPTTNYDFYGSSLEIPLDRRYMLRRDDHLVYTSRPLNSPVPIRGSPITELYISSDCKDTDFFVHLFNVFPDERSILSSHGLMRARYRNGLEKQELMEQGEIYKIIIPMSSTGLIFLKDHRIRLSITSSEFPRYGRNNNTGNLVDTDIEFKIAENVVYHGTKYQSRLLLPTIIT